jgi:ornithine cyclodeaminase/alanine dehydrogenase-like protein (mu-crystallin family)
MKRELQIVGIDVLRPLLHRRKVIDAVRQALIRQAQGKVQSPLPGQLLFRDPPGDCHIKYGHVAGSQTFAIKIATGFYENPRRGLPSNDGLVLLFDANTGTPTVLFKDDGWLTAWRTAAAAAIAAATLGPPEVVEIGIVGTGLQASLALEWLPETLGDKPFVVWGRDFAKATALAGETASKGRRARAVLRIEQLLERCNIVVTTTPSAVPLFSADGVRPGTHVVGVGADSPGKQELPVELFRRAEYVLTDDHAQCLDHGDFGAAVRARAVAADADVMLGRVLESAVKPKRNPLGVTVVDLTGLAAEDIAIAGLFSELLAASI